LKKDIKRRGRERPEAKESKPMMEKENFKIDSSDRKTKKVDIMQKGASRKLMIKVNPE
jgi:hypothetical protein